MPRPNAAGYRVGQSEQIKIRIGLPLNIADGGTGGVQGAWNGKNRDLGGGGYAGAVGGVTSSTNRGYVGTSTDTGHSAADGGSFALNPDKTLNWGLIRDFARDGIHAAHIWGISVAKAYYAMEPSRKYWMGCSTGGRQGHYLAQNFPNPFQGGTTFQFALPERSTVSLKVFDLAGREVATVVDGVIDPGEYEYPWQAVEHGRALAPGMYVYRMTAHGEQTGRFQKIRKMILIK